MVFDSRVSAEEQAVYSLSRISKSVSKSLLQNVHASIMSCQVRKVRFGGYPVCISLTSQGPKIQERTSSRTLEALANRCSILRAAPARHICNGSHEGLETVGYANASVVASAVTLYIWAKRTSWREKETSVATSQTTVFGAGSERSAKGSGSKRKK